MPNSFELQEYLKKNTSSYDILITTKSYQERTLRGKQILKTYGTKIGNIIFIQFVNADLKSKKPTFTKSSNEEVVLCAYQNVGEGIKLISDALKKFKKSGKTPRIIIDITGFIAPYLFPLLKELVRIEKINEIDVIYTAPLTYEKKKDSYLFSEGITFVREIKNFYGTSKAIGLPLLVSILGFEGHRSFEVLNSQEPKKTIALNGFPPYSLEFKDTSILENKDLLNHSSCLQNIVPVAAHDPFQTERTLDKIYSDYNEEYDVVISPLGTKPMSLGACIFCIKHDNVRVVYPFATKYLEDKVPKKSGKTWIYKFTKILG